MIRSKKILLWTNPNTTWTTENIILSSNDYDELEVFYTATHGTTDAELHMRFSKGRNIDLLYLATSTSAMSDNWIMQRSLIRNSDISFTPTLGRIERWGSSSGAAEQKHFCVPRQIYGIKYLL